MYTIKKEEEEEEDQEDEEEEEKEDAAEQLYSIDELYVAFNGRKSLIRYHKKFL